jgi:hypothetical protein
MDNQSRQARPRYKCIPAGITPAIHQLHHPLPRHLLPYYRSPHTCVSTSNPSPPFKLTATYALFGPSHQVDYLIPRPDSSFIVGGARSTFTHDRSHWYNCVDDSSLILLAKNYFDGYMQRHILG